jgi:pimeloyl-ACP methyl ester carboxylesterase
MWRDFWELDLAPDYAAVRAPTLALSGGADGQVVPDENVPALRQAMTSGANPPLVVSVVPAASHSLRGPRTPRGQFADGVVDTLVSWLREQGQLR